MENSQFAREQIAAEAVDWFLQIQDACPTASDQKAFIEWLLRSPTHIEEYLAISCAWRGLNVPNEGRFDAAALIAAAQAQPDPDNVVRLWNRKPRHRDQETWEFRRHLPRKGWIAFAASVVLTVGLFIGHELRDRSPQFQTAIGEQRSITLADGSVVYLNTASLVRVRWTAAERRMDLVRGEAEFKVAHNHARPFIVTTSQATVRAVGTIFNVRADDSGTQVAVIEGRVEVKALMQQANAPHGDDLPEVQSNTSGRSSRTPRSVHLFAGQRAKVTAGGIAPNAGPPVEAIAAWTQRRLVFREEALAEVVAEFNRYRTQPLVLDDQQLAALKISGAFDLRDPESLIIYLETFESVRVEHSRDGVEHLSRKPAPTDSTN